MSRPVSSNGYKVLKAYRQMKSMNQKNMADYLDISLAAYSDKENHITEFTLTEARNISLLFNKSIEQIFFTDEVHL